MSLRHLNPPLADFLEQNPTPSLSYLPDGNTGDVHFYLKDRLAELYDFLSPQPLPTEFGAYREGSDAIVRATFFTRGMLFPYQAETEFRHDVPEQVEALHRVLGQQVVEIHFVDDSLAYLTTKRYADAPLREYRDQFRGWP